MARLDYYAIEEGIKTTLEADSALDGVKIHIEEESLFSNDECPAIFIYIESRDAPIDMQRLAAGTRTDFQMRFSLWCVEFHLESIPKAAELRDDLLGNAEVALMKDRVLGGTVVKAWLEGGRFLSGEVEGGFIMAAEIILVADGIATTA